MSSFPVVACLLLLAAALFASVFSSLFHLLLIGYLN